MTNDNVSPRSESQVRATVQDRAPQAAGLLPKNTQQLVILGVAVVMVLIMWLTSGGKRPKSPGPAQSGASGSSAQPPNPAAVEDFRHTIQQDQAATRQPISPSSLARLEALGLVGDVSAAHVPLPAEASTPEPGAPIGDAAANGAGYPNDPLKEDRKKRQYLSLFAPNVAFTSRNGADAEQVLGSKSASSSHESSTLQSPVTADQGPQTPTAQVSVLIPAPESRSEGAAASAANANPPTSARREPVRSDLLDAASGKKYLLIEGTLLETVLLNRLNGSFAGPVACLVSTDLYSHDRQHVLIPAGTKVLGEAKKVDSIGQQRLAVFFHRLVMPDGYSVSLDQFKGLNQAGETALRDQVNNHYLQIFGASLAVGILGGVSQAGTGNALTNSPFDRVREGFGASLATSGSDILEHFLNILPTVTIREGSRVKISLAGDLLLPDYAQHTTQPDL